MINKIKYLYCFYIAFFIIIPVFSSFADNKHLESENKNVAIKAFEKLYKNVKVKKLPYFYKDAILT